MGVLSLVGFKLIVVLGLITGKPVWLTETVMIMVGSAVSVALKISVATAVLD